MNTVGKPDNVKGKVMQCKVPLFPREPNIHICIREKGHDEHLHMTYTARNENIYFEAKNREA